MTYSINKFAIPYKVVATAPINEAMQYIEDALNVLDNKTEKIDEKIDLTEKGSPLGVATLDINGTVPDAQIKKGSANGVASLDENGVLTSTQIPQQVFTQVFEVNSLSEMLELEANIGDVCKRLDVGGTFLLKNADPTDINSWTEISVQGQYIALTTDVTVPFETEFDENSWDYINNQYQLTFLQEEHQVGSNVLFVAMWDDNKNYVRPDYKTYEDGTVKIFSDVAFGGSVIITDLGGNNSNNNKVAYCINYAPYDSNGKEVALIKSDDSTITLNTTTPVVISDGFNNLQVIRIDQEIEVDDYDDGYYEIFYDSEYTDEEDTYVEASLTLVPQNLYSGVVKVKPSHIEEDMRCYVAYGQSWIVKNAEWVLKPFTHIGSVVVKNGKVEKLFVRPYSQNEIATNAFSHNKDYLFSSKLNNIKVVRGDSLYNSTNSVGAKLTIDKCLSSDGKRILEVNANGVLVKNLRQISQPVDFVHVYAIGDDYGNDELVTCGKITTDFLSEYKTHYRRILSIPYYNDKVDTDFTMFDDTAYFGLRCQHKFKKELSSERGSGSSQPYVVYRLADFGDLKDFKNVEFIYYCKADVDCSLQITGLSGDIASNMLYIGSGKCFTFTASSEYNIISIQPDTDVNLEVGIFGYKEK